jgi:hypothetical protein
VFLSLAMIDSQKVTGLEERMLFVGLAIFMIFVLPLVFQFLWNITVPEIFGLRTIKYGKLSTCFLWRE